MAHNKKYMSLINTARWRRLRARILAGEPLCQDCKERGVYAAATEVHHVIPVESMSDLSAMERLCYDPSNLRPLCRACHKAAHMSMGKGTKKETRRRAEQSADEYMQRVFGIEPAPQE